MNIDKIFDLYHKYGSNDYIGEPVSQTEHMVQAAMLAQQDNQSKEVIISALFHDIGHLIGLENDSLETMGNVGVKAHEKVGAEYLRNLGVPEPIPYLVESHVKAKRYLCYKNLKYLINLSSASKETLIHQGGPMRPNEAFQFEKDKYFETILKLRTYDEKAKDTNIKINDLDDYKQILRDILLN